MKDKLKTVDFIYIGFSAAVICICSWISVPVGAVPITFQTLAICLVSGLFGLKRGTFAILIYIVLGAVGLPVYAEFKCGIGVLLGSTGGYIFGFILTAVIVGFVSDKSTKLWALVCSMALGVAACYAVGTLWFMLVYSKETSAMTFSKTAAICITPFVIPDIAKIILASLLTVRLKKHIKLKGRNSYENETQKES